MRIDDRKMADWKWRERASAYLLGSLARLACLFAPFFPSFLPEGPKERTKNESVSHRIASHGMALFSESVR